MRLWHLVVRRMQDRETLDDLFDEMKKLRIEIAKEGRFLNYVEFDL